MRQKKDLRAPVAKRDGMTGTSPCTWTPAAHRKTAFVAMTCSATCHFSQIFSCFPNLDAATDLLAASMRHCWGADDASCSFTLLMSLGWMKSNKLCPVSSSCEPKWHACTYSPFTDVSLNCLCSCCVFKSTFCAFPNNLLPCAYFCVFSYTFTVMIIINLIHLKLTWYDFRTGHVCRLYIQDSKCIWTLSDTSE